MNKELTDITVVLDRSGSMCSVATDIPGGFDTFIDSQKKVPGKALLTLVQFDTLYEFVHRAIDIQNVPKLEFVPRGGTALLDAMGRAIAETGERLSRMNENDRPAKVVVVIITDGEENASKEYTKARVAEMIKHQTEKYSWEFVFLAANQDAIKEATAFNINAANAINYVHTKAGYNAVFESVSSNLCNYRVGASSMGFSQHDRDAAMDKK